MIDEPSPDFAAQLIKADSWNDDLRTRYEQQKLALVERRLTRVQQWVGWLSLPVYPALVVGVLYRRLTTGERDSREWLILEMVSAIVLLALGGWILWVLLRQGRVTWRDDRAMEWIGGIGLAALTFSLYELARSLPDAKAALGLHEAATIILVLGASAIVFERVRRSRLETRVELLELELRYAELARQIRSSVDRI